MKTSTKNNPIYKSCRLATLCGLCLFPLIPLSSHAQILDHTSFNFWHSDINTTLNPGNARSGGASEDITVETQVSQYAGTGELTRVVIRVQQPSLLDPTIPSSLMTLGITATNGDAITSSNETQNHMLSITHLTETSIDGALTGYGESALGGSAANTTYHVEQFSNSYHNTSINDGDTINRTLDNNNGPIVIFDSTNTSLTTIQLHSIFAGTGMILFDMELSSGFRWDFEDDTQYPDLTAVIDGINSGDIHIDYYIIPEPGTLAMIVIAFGSALGLMMIRRK